MGNDLNYLNFQRIHTGISSPPYFFSHAHLRIAFEWNWGVKTKKTSLWLKTVSYFSDQGAMALQRSSRRLALHLIWWGKEFWTLYRALILMCTHRQNSVWVDKSKMSYVIPCLRDVLTASFTSRSNNFFVPVFLPYVLNSLLPTLPSHHELVLSSWWAGFIKCISPVLSARCSWKMVSDRVDQYMKMWSLLTPQCDF